LSLDEDIITYNRGVALLEKGNFKKALQIFKKVQHKSKELYNNLGVTYRALGQDKLMFSCYKAALECDSALGDGDQVNGQALNNLGLAYYMYGNDTEAIKCYTRAIKINPKGWDAWWNASTAHLRIASSTGVGFPKAWEMYKARFLKSKPIKMKNSKEDLIYWDGVSSGKSIIVLTEQGIGDNIMWGRYLPELTKKFEKVYVQADVSLYDLFLEYNPVPDAVHTDATVAYPICSLGEHFDYIPPAEWLAGRFGSFDFGPGFNIGIVWSGNAAHTNDKYRSVDIRRFHRLAAYGNLYSLQPGFRGDGVVKPLDINSWSDTAKYINGLDLVIGIDTSVMHLVGSLGANGWLLQPYKETDFRWGTVSEDFGSSVWYPRMKIFNNPQSWETVFNRVEECLQSHVKELAVLS